MSQLADMAVRAPESSLRLVHLERNRGTSQVSFKQFPILRLESFFTFLQEPCSPFRFLAVNLILRCSLPSKFSRPCGRRAGLAGELCIRPVQRERCFTDDPRNKQRTNL